MFTHVKSRLVHLSFRSNGVCCVCSRKIKSLLYSFISIPLFLSNSPGIPELPQIHGIAHKSRNLPFFKNKTLSIALYKEQPLTLVFITGQLLAMVFIKEVPLFIVFIYCGITPTIEEMQRNPRHISNKKFEFFFYARLSLPFKRD